MITVAQIGCGYWGPNLLRNFVANDQCQVKWVCDSAPERQAYVAKYYPSVGVTADFQAVLADRDVTAVVIATPVREHYDQTMACLEAGKHVLVEKPLARTPEEVERIRDLADRRGLLVMTGHTFLYNPAVLQLKRLVDAGELGPLRYIYSRRLNLGRIRSDVDVWWNLAPHDVSIVQYLLDDREPIAVHRHGMDYVQPGIQDVAFVHMAYPDKIMVHIHVSWLDPTRVRCLTVVGERKMVVYDDTSENKIAIFDKGIDRVTRLGQTMDYDEFNFIRFNHRVGDVSMPRVDPSEPLKNEIAHFLACLEGKQTCRTGPAHALSVVRILARADQGPKE